MSVEYSLSLGSGWASADSNHRFQLPSHDDESFSDGFRINDAGSILLGGDQEHIKALYDRRQHESLATGR